MNFIEKVKNIESELIETRRYLHQHPELSEQEFETQKYLMKRLDELNIPYEKVGITSLVAHIKGGKPGKTVALRSDIDALPILEQSGASYSSKEDGKMHACGHDGHMSMLLGAAKMLTEIKDELPGEVRLLFQEAEETFTGARRVVADGGMEGVDAVFGMHGMPIDVGTYDLNPGYRMAGCDTIYVSFEGVSGHGSMPHKAKDTILPAAEFVTQLNAMITKFVNSQSPIVLTVGKFDGGTKANVISKYTQLDISMRYLHEETRQVIHNKIKDLASGLATIYDISIKVEIEESTISMYNDEKITEVAAKSAEKVFGPGKNVEGPIMMGSEDMPYYFEEAPGAYALMGYRNEEKDTIYFPHHEKFNIDEDYLKFGAALHAQFAWDYLHMSE
ncbi:amidohydrolase [Facklamia sp. 7083-14-GEN3]|uniref:amidohydrolase n=1 Tax=Facklamia sp. 7083-14-GEN3 TaxID=2973478 RepID=UPI00215BD6DF|nr:amidohydrolase [Facklamia sp. 7083-14-GEN3]MCR8969051.1 amidohydrolase [Facklamia sp. 7083-14-GEN3]